MSILYIVPTPIGNLEDMTLRAIRILKEVHLILAEDTRTSRVLLNHFEITTPMSSYHEHNKIGKIESILESLQMGDIALISDAGTPGISDPGYELIQAAIAAGVTVVPLPGANAVLPALVASGLPTDRFTYLGFLPRKEKALHDFLEQYSQSPQTMIVYESPHRVLEALQAIERVFGQRQICVAREISKMFEEFVRGDVSSVIQHFQDQNPRGEITIVIAGASEDEKWTEAKLRQALAGRLSEGESLSYASKALAKISGWQKRDIYTLGNT
ncbi:16S rRNA (cytidine(1402)-2'-O)-methyltransferase [Anaerolineales bacterium]